MYKRVISLILTAAMLFSLLPVNVQAESNKADTDVVSGDMNVTGTNGFGKLLSDAIDDELDASEEETEEYEAGYSICDVVINESEATVTYSIMEEARLVVALYSEDGMQLLNSVSVTVFPEETAATATFEGKCPNIFWFPCIFWIHMIIHLFAQPTILLCIPRRCRNCWHLPWRTTTMSWC